MKTEREKIDKLIKESLSQDEAKFYEELHEQNIMEKLGEVYWGKMGWLAITMNIIHVLLFVLFVYCLVQFIQTEELNMLIKWSAAGLCCLIAMGMLKLYVWMQMDKNDILRELKRIELQLASLSSTSDN